MTTDEIARFWSRVSVSPSDACWIWLTATTRLCINGKGIGPRRVSWMLHNGLSIPDNQRVLTTCDITLCVNPNHLVLETQAYILERTAERFWPKVDKREPNQCWEWLAGTNHDGYGKFRYNGKDGSAHRVSWILANGDIPKGLSVLHECDNPPCVNPYHLFLGTNQDNMDDKVSKNRVHRPTGRVNKMSKLTEDQVREIRKRYANEDITHEALAKEYNMSRSGISPVIRGENWAHIKEGML